MRAPDLLLLLFIKNVILKNEVAYNPPKYFFVSEMSIPQALRGAANLVKLIYLMRSLIRSR